MCSPLWYFIVPVVFRRIEQLVAVQYDRSLGMRNALHVAVDLAHDRRSVFCVCHSGAASIMQWYGGRRMDLAAC